MLGKYAKEARGGIFFFFFFDTMNGYITTTKSEILSNLSKVFEYSQNIPKNTSEGYNSQDNFVDSEVIRKKSELL